ncbi:MFS transporter [Novosphingobium sp. JCM 18896]|uniref:MFS transporter n=1 Tax=Novosphingobium sp. JCM 18896 TaxID=2989731 RepID=UPI002222F465|nr:MFS transporter [Novosphingobium sp. JCM 18896]MCW1431638.1 MFS transporter [Novosphingobium sp. JCM 18896]
MAGLIVSVLDRGVINLLVEPIKGEFGLSDTEFGALQSIAFATFYVTMAIPIGVLADRYKRSLIIAVGVCVFSAFSLMTGLARNFTQLFVARMGVGFGEASINPAGYSMISDYFPPAKLGRAASLFSASNFVGASFAYVLGGVLLGAFETLHSRSPGYMLGLAPWQATVVSIALPGLLLGPIMFLLREPPRQGLAGRKVDLGLREILGELGSRRRFLVLVFAGMSMASIMTQAVSVWTPALFIRVYGWSATQAGIWIGLVILLGSVIGSYLGGWITDWMTTRDRLDAPILIATVSFAVGGVFGVAAPLMPSGEGALLMLLPMLFLKPMAFACAPMALQMVMPNQLRAQVTAGYLTILNLVGLGLGPMIVGIMTDRLFTDPGDVRYSMSLVSLVTVPAMAILMAFAIRPFADLRRALARNETN